MFVVVSTIYDMGKLFFQLRGVTTLSLIQQAEYFITLNTLKSKNGLKRIDKKLNSDLILKLCPFIDKRNSYDKLDSQWLNVMHCRILNLKLLTTAKT